MPSSLAVSEEACKEWGFVRLWSRLNRKRRSCTTFGAIRPRPAGIDGVAMAARIIDESIGLNLLVAAILPVKSSACRDASYVEVLIHTHTQMVSRIARNGSDNWIILKSDSWTIWQRTMYR